MAWKLLTRWASVGLQALECPHVNTLQHPLEVFRRFFVVLWLMYVNCRLFVLAFLSSVNVVIL